jgi:hypothetical protein
MENEYEIWFRDPRLLFKNMLANRDFHGFFDYAPFRQYDNKGNRQYEHLMSGDWAWKQAVSAHLIFHWCTLRRALKDIISKDPTTHGALFVPIILGSDKTTVSVATGHIEYWPLYGSIGNIHNNMRRAHGSGLVLVGFLSIPKSLLLCLCVLHLLTLLCHQPIRPIQMMLTSASFGGSFFMSHFHIFCNHFGLVRSLLKSFDVLMDIFGASYGE